MAESSRSFNNVTRQIAREDILSIQNIPREFEEFNSNSIRPINFNRKYLFLTYSRQLHFTPPDGISVNLSCQ